MFYWILSTICASFATIFWKKALAYKCPNRLFALLWFSFWPVIISVIFLLWKYDFWVVNIKLSLIIIFLILLQLLVIQMDQHIYKNEKISVIIPYQNLNKILSIILAFFIFTNISKLSFFITLLAWIIIIIFSIDFKNFVLSRFIKIIFIWQWIISIQLLLVWYILNYLNPLSYYVLSVGIIVIIWSIIVFFTKEYKNLFDMTKDFYINRWLGSTLWEISYVINTFIIAKLWVIMSILFSYMYIWVVLILSYLFFKDKPSRKNIILTIIISILVWLWYFYK